MTKQEAMALRAAMEKAAVSLDDKDASTAATMFPQLKGDGSLIKAGTRVNWRGKVKKAAVDLWDTEQNTPDAAPVLWEDIDYVNGVRKIPEVITVTSAFAQGEEGWWKGTVYVSLLANNVWTPDAYPNGWEVVR